MKSFDTEIKKYSESVTLTTSERRALREQVASYMEYHPLHARAAVVKDRETLRGAESFIIFRPSTLQLRLVAGFFAVVLVFLPFAAERSVPGDVLYLVKTGFNETIQGGFISTPYEKIEFETKLMERRIAEARALASEGKLTDEAQAAFEETVKEHTNAVQTSLAELRTQDADKAAIAQIAFNASLEVQSVVLGDSDNATNTDAIAALRTVVNEVREESIQEQGTTTPSYEALVAQVESETTRAYELFESVQDSATPQEASDIERRLKDADRLIRIAQNVHDTNLQKATNDLTMTLGLVQKLIVFMSNLDVRETIALQEIVPIVLSDAERTEIVRTGLVELKKLQQKVDSQREALTDPALSEKITTTATRTAAQITAIETALQIEDIDSAEGLVVETRALLIDMDTLIAQNGGSLLGRDEIPEVPEPVSTTTPEEGSED